MPYHLHAICIHDGTAESGHYYSYIRDFKQNVWRKYDDHRVSEVDEAQVFEEAQGGGGTKSAYYMTYLSESEINVMRKFDINSFRDLANDFEKEHPYGKISRDKTLKKIKEDNLQLKESINEFINDDILKRVAVRYERHF